MLTEIVTHTKRTNNYFQKDHYFIPILHPARYYHGIYGSPSMRPPMGLQYIIWAIGAEGNDKYRFYSEVFYQRARAYGDADEMKVRGLLARVIQRQSRPCMLTGNLG